MKIWDNMLDTLFLFKENETGVDAGTDIWNKKLWIVSLLHVSKSTTSTHNASKMVKFKQTRKKAGLNWLRLASNSFENYIHTSKCLFFFYSSTCQSVLSKQR